MRSFRTLCPATFWVIWRESLTCFTISLPRYNFTVQQYSSTLMKGFTSQQASYFPGILTQSIKLSLSCFRTLPHLSDKLTHGLHRLFLVEIFDVLSPSIWPIRIRTSSYIGPDQISKFWILPGKM